MNGIIDGLPILDYIKDPAPVPSLSASLAHVLLTRSPRHAWRISARLNPAWTPDESEARQDIGTIVHSILLEGDRSRIAVIDAPDYRSKAAQTAREIAHAEGKLPILAERMLDVEACVEAAHQQLDACEIPETFHEGHAERTLIWKDADGVTWRARPDWMSGDSKLVVDLKTTQGSAEPHAWSGGPLLAHGADMQAALILRGMDVLFGPATRTFVFAVLETTPPYALSLVGLDPYYLQFANEKLDDAAAQWTHCLATNHWPAYPKRICWASPPEWAVKRWGERGVLAEAAVDNGEGEVDQL